MAMVGVMMCIGTACGSSTEKTTEKHTEKTEQVTLTIAAAASLEYSMKERLIPMFEQANEGVTVEGVYDSSGKLQTQIEEGLGADIFFSAATKQMDTLAEEGYMDTATIKNRLENKLVLIVPKDSKGSIKEFKDIEKAKTIAIGDPESVPVGQYSKEALTNLGVWDTIQDNISFGTNVTEVLNWVAEGSADAGIVYATDAATTDKVSVIAEAPEGSLAEDVVYPVGVLKNSENKEMAEKFVQFLCSDDASKVLKQYGFTPISE